jgi:hypothetical protein
MPLLSEHQSNSFTKLCCMGSPGTGKTGALTSLVGAGYKLRILDFDNGLESLKNFIYKDCPDQIGNVEYLTLRDRRKASAIGPQVIGQPKAFITALKMLDRWKYDDIDLGPPSEWGPECILVLDTLTFLSDAAYLFYDSMSTNPDKRSVYGDAQKGILAMLGQMYSDHFETNVIVNSHIVFQETDEGKTKGFPASIGSAINSKINAYFNTVALFETKAGGARTIKTVPTATIDLKNPKPFDMAKEYPIETGLASIFEVLRAKPETKVTPLKRKA